MAGKGSKKKVDDALAKHMPTPQAAAVAVMAMLAFGTILGSVTGHFAVGAGAVPIVIEEPEPTAQVTVAEAAPAPAAATPEPIATPATAAVPTTAPEPVPQEPAPTSASAPSAPPELPPEFTLPPIDHVFLVVLGSVGFEKAFGGGASPYMKTLTSKGELLSNYYGVAEGELANEVALLSGQGPTLQTTVNCPEYTPLAAAPSTTPAEAEQVEGSGCIYPADTATLPGQLAEAKKSWRFYVKGMADGSTAPQSCRRPASGLPDPTWLPGAVGAYRTWLNPAVYFESLAPSCEGDDVDISQLGADLHTAKRTPNLAYIAPDACHDGSAEPICEAEGTGGAAGAAAFLEEVIPAVEASPAFATGLIAIVPSEAPQEGAEADPSSCCGTPEYPNLATPPTTEPATGPVKPEGGGGKVGMLLISPFVEPGSVNESGYFNHFSTLRSVEELFGLPAIGYASEPAITGFDETVYTGTE